MKTKNTDPSDLKSFNGKLNDIGSDAKDYINEEKKVLNRFKSRKLNFRLYGKFSNGKERSKNFESWIFNQGQQ